MLTTHVNTDGAMLISDTEDVISLRPTTYVTTQMVVITTKPDVTTSPTKNEAITAENLNTESDVMPTKGDIIIAYASYVTPQIVPLELEGVKLSLCEVAV